ncbi:hypothetical protein [Bacillus sp. AFS040349]|uniref:hypothetical protein n=1 Tax=Bacillus sp. AFS040349 TaxID=2033502 RepID=UPI000BFD7813|nr:hypothetical protein [Bacillus sp. AFS040349]PGT80555.1 hypothetical protein COD11_20815 [Bacillus sp. AFS040349]
MFIFDHIDRIVNEVIKGNSNWEVEMLETLFDTHPLGNDFFEYYEELCFLLNNGIITCEVDYYKEIEDPEKKDEMYTIYSICTDTRGSGGTLIWYAWNWLLEKGASDTKFARYGANLHTESLNISIKVGSGRPRRILEDILPNGTTYVHYPYGTNNNECFSFKPTEAFFEWNEKKKLKRLEEMKKLATNFFID